jgi:ubiquitin-protein ligase E3 C
MAAHQLNWYRFIGRVLGKALYEGILIEVGFASFFLGKVFPGSDVCLASI